MSDDLVERLRSGLDNCDRDSDGLELGGVVMTMREAAARIQGLEAALARREANRETAMLDAAEEHARADRLAALLREAKEALRPFAAYGALRGMDLVPDDMALTNGSSFAARQVTAGDFRRARAFFARLEAREVSHD